MHAPHVGREGDAEFVRINPDGLRRGWPLPAGIDRVHDPSAAAAALGWRSRFGFEEVLVQHDARSIEVLPRSSWFRDATTE